MDRVEVVIVGAGPAGAATAVGLAGAGREVVVIERSPEWRWRAGGVFASPAAIDALLRSGLDESVVRRVARPVPAMRVETPGGVAFRLTYGADSGSQPAVGLDRSELDPALLALATAAGATVRRGVTVTSVSWPDGPRRRAIVAFQDRGGRGAVEADVVVGADGIRSVVARSVGTARPARLAARTGLTYHLADPRPCESREARMRVLRDGYAGFAPVAGGRINVGIVLGPTWRPALARDGAVAVAESIVGAVPAIEGDPADWRSAARLDTIAGAAPVGHRVATRAGPGWLLAGDAAGFLDPFTGEGLHRALVSADLAAFAVDRHLAGRADALEAYDHSMRSRFAGKDVVSWLVQAFLGRPALFEYVARRLASRDAARETMGLVMGDLIPASRALEPRYLAALLRP